ncbi:proteoglycan 4-like [Planococcus citri]|uniref:proteoglycan 4-like n=1 Tax=Planococcus citri TaxID=170843 RepID=UPI0031F8F38B
MEPSLIYLLVLAFCGVGSISCAELSDEQLRVLFDTPFDIEEFVNNMFDLPPSQELYVYEYLLDLIGNLEKDSKMAKFLNASLNLLQQKIDQFNEQHKLQKVQIRKFIQKRIDVQLKAEAKKGAANAAGNKPGSTSEKPTPTICASKPSLKSQPSSEKNSKDSADQKPTPKGSENPISITKKMNSEPKPTTNNAIGSQGSKNYKLKPEKSELENKKNTLQKSEPVKEPPSSKNENLHIVVTSKSKSNIEKPLLQLIQAPLPTNPLNFILSFDDDEPSKKKKMHSSRKAKNTPTTLSSAPAPISKTKNSKLSPNSKQTQPNVQAFLPTKPLAATSKHTKLKSEGLNKVTSKPQPKSPEPEKKPTSRANENNSKASLSATPSVGRKSTPPSTSIKDSSQKIPTPKPTNPASIVNRPKVELIKKDIKPAKTVETTTSLVKPKIMTKPRLDEKSSKQKPLQSGNSYVDPEAFRLHQLRNRTETANKASFSV